MSYLALARKYRPQEFTTVAAQNFITTTLQNAINMGRVSHAYLFTGPRGVGKTTTARIFAKAINCLQPNGSNPCGVCENCTDIAEGTSLDVIEIDGASNRGVDEIRSLREAVKFIPVKSKYKVYIIDEVHMLTKEAFNALLKTLEEPPSFVIFIFATTDVQKLPATIVSRCQRYEFKKIPIEEMKNTIITILNKENITFEEEAILQIIKEADGGMRDALSLLDQVIAYTEGSVDLKNTSELLGISDKYLADEIFTIILNEEPEKLSSVIENIDSKGLDFKFVTENLIEHTRNMLFLLSSGEMPSKNYTKSEKDFYLSLKNITTKHKLYALFQLFLKTYNDLKYFDFERYIFEFALFKAASISQVVPFDGGVVGIVSGATNVEKKIPVPLIDTSITLVKTPPPMASVMSEIMSASDIWQKSFDMIIKQGSPLSANLQYGMLQSATSEKIVVGFHSDRAFQYKYFSSPENKEKVEKVFATFTKTPPRFEVVLDNSDSKKKAPIEIKAEAESYKDRLSKSEAVSNDFVKSVLETLNGTIEDVKLIKN